RKLHFGLMFGLAKRITESLVVSKRLEPGQLVQIADPSIAYSLGNRARQRRVGDQQPASGGDAVSLIVETVREHFSEIPDRSRAEQFGMNCSNAVGAVGTYNCQICHPNLVLGSILDEARACQASFIPWKATAHLIEQAPVDLKDDLQMTRHQHFKPRERPFL